MILEWSSLRAWVKQWLKYCHWYYSIALSPDVTLEVFFDAPVINRSWKTSRPIGLMWKIYDMVALKGVDLKLPILEPTSGSLYGEPYILGGETGGLTTFRCNRHTDHQV
jgi:hypothetical protein